mmetsp:Transcript_3255/g.3588  ORF Transcript_3255/g.3588 Transcript_3255/m.3588 type:complete len:227 (+) Transcript_3255:27-707(+)
MSSKKAQDKAKAKIIEDRTFGLKNKNRSAKVQAFVQSVSKSVKQGNPDQRKKEAENEQKRKEKEAKRAFEEEMSKLFKNADQGKKTAEEVNGGEGDEDLGCNPDDYLFRPEDFDDVEADNTRLEEKLEAEREALKGRTDLTPVTEESFQAWKAQKRKEAADKEAARLKKAKESGTLRGWDLWQHDKDLFVDDEEADEFYEREELEEEDADEPCVASSPKYHDPSVM